MTSDDLCHLFWKLNLFRDSEMKKHMSPLDVQQVNAFADDLFESALKYVILNVLQPAFPDLTSIREKHFEFPEEIGRVVMILISENRFKDIYLEIIEIECDISESDVHSTAVMSFLDSKILNFGNCLARGDCHDCLMFIAIVCQILLRFSSSRANAITNRIIQKAKESLRMHAEVNEHYVNIASYARSFLNEYYSNS